MKVWIFDELADTEPDGNSRWYNANEVDEEIEQLQKRTNELKEVITDLQYDLIYYEEERNEH